MAVATAERPRERSKRERDVDVTVRFTLRPSGLTHWGGARCVVPLGGRVQARFTDADVSGMNGPGGRATPGLDGAIALLAEGAERPRVLRESLSAALRATHATHALLLGARIGDPTTLAAIGTGCTPLEAATREALAGSPSRRSDPVAGTNAAALPVWGGSRVVAAIGVAGPADILDPTPLDTAVDVVSLALRRAAGTDAVHTTAEWFSSLAEVSDAEEAAAELLEVVTGLGGLPAFICVEEEGRLRVARYQGLERERLTTLVASEDFRTLVQTCRRGDLADASVLSTEDPAEFVGSVPVGRDRWHGLIGVVGGRDELDRVLPSLVAAATVAGHALDRVLAAAEIRRRASDLDALVDAIPAPVLLLDGDARLVRANPPAVERFALSGEFDRGRSVVDRFRHPELERLFLGGEGDIEVEFGVPARQYTVRGRSLPDGDRRVIVFADASAEHEKVRLTEEFVSVMGHELRTPLTVVQGSLQTVTAQGEKMAPEDRTTLLASALRQSTHLGHLVEDLLLMSTEATGRPSLNVTKHRDRGSPVRCSCRPIRRCRPGG